MKKLLLGILVCVLTVTLSACGTNKSNDDSKTKTTKKITMSDIIYGKQKRAIVRAETNRDPLVSRIYIVKGGKVKTFYLWEIGEAERSSMSDLSLEKASKMSVDELEKYGEKAQREAGFPPAFTMPVKYWVTDGEVAYGMMGYSSYVSTPGVEPYGKTQESASKYFTRVSDFKKDPDDEGSYKFKAVPKLTQQDARSNGLEYDNVVNNDYMKTSDGKKMVGYDMGSKALLTKVDDDVEMVPEKDE